MPVDYKWVRTDISAFARFLVHRTPPVRKYGVENLLYGFRHAAYIRVYGPGYALELQHLYLELAKKARQMIPRFRIEPDDHGLETRSLPCFDSAAEPLEDLASPHLQLMYPFGGGIHLLETFG